MDLTGKVALVTGGQQGIGRAVALRLARDGADIALNYLDDPEAAEAITKAIADDGRRCLPIDADVSRAAEVERLIETAERDLGPIDILVNNAAIFPRSPFLDLSEELWDSVLGVNLKGTFLCAQAVARRLVAAGRSGVIVNFTSGAPYRGSRNASHYQASKLGVVGLTRGMATELGPRGIRVNAVAPGITDTAMPRLGNSEEALQAMGRALPLGRLAQPEDIADAVAFLVSDAARHITGQVLHINGGDYLA